MTESMRSQKDEQRVIFQDVEVTSETAYRAAQRMADSACRTDSERFLPVVLNVLGIRELAQEHRSEEIAWLEATS